MPYTYSIESEHQLGIVELTGYVDADTLVEATDAMMDDAAWGPTYHSIWNFLRAHTLDITPEGLDRLIQRKLERDRKLGAGGKIAVVIRRNALEAITGLAKHLASTPVREMEFFDALEAAHAWVGMNEH